MSLYYHPLQSCADKKIKNQRREHFTAEPIHSQGSLPSAFCEYTIAYILSQYYTAHFTYIHTLSNNFMNRINIIKLKTKF